MGLMVVWNMPQFQKHPEASRFLILIPAGPTFPLSLLPYSFIVSLSLPHWYEGFAFCEAMLNDGILKVEHIFITLASITSIFVMGGNAL